jgi:hypothetical protein
MITGEMSDSETLARIFHMTYERLAPEFGYETRDDTREFDPNSKNGRLMRAVCAEILSQLVPRIKYENQANLAGELADTCDNLIAATNLPMPPAFHVTQLRAGLGDLSKSLKGIQKNYLDYRPWDELEELKSEW